VAHQDGALFGLVVRDVSRRLSSMAESRAVSPASEPATALLAPLAQLDEQIGRLPLMQLVRDSGDLIERHCIEAALERAAGNRTAAAALLGLSRQSLYAKLARHGLGSGGAGPETG
jgi:DNA-binding NtrC family response regulator